MKINKKIKIGHEIERQINKLFDIDYIIVKKDVANKGVYKIIYTNYDEPDRNYLLVEVNKNNEVVLHQDNNINLEDFLKDKGYKFLN